MDIKNAGRYHGSLVAFEGPADVVSTQLRLLPTSSQVLILPGLQHYMKGDNRGRFSARSYVKNVHEAALARHKVALRFLDESSQANKRLVFLNGGTAGAMSYCISAISKYQTSGNSIHAESLLRNILNDGTKGLDQEDKYLEEEALHRRGSEDAKCGVIWDDEDMDPVTTAMRAADALYKETESLEPIECYIRTRSRSLSVPMPGWEDCAGQASPFFVFGSAPSEGSQFGSKDRQERPTGGNDEDANGMCTIRGSQQSIEILHSMAYIPPSSVDGADITSSIGSRPSTQPSSPTHNMLLSPPITPVEVEYGEARVIQMQAPRNSFRRTRSLDDVELHQSLTRRATINKSQLPERVSSLGKSKVKSLCRHLSIAEDSHSRYTVPHMAQARLVKASTTTIRRSPTFPKNMPKPTRELYAHRGTKTGRFLNGDDGQEAVFEPVFPFQEDLVIHFTGESPDIVLESVIESFESGLYPVCTPLPDLARTVETGSGLFTPQMQHFYDLDYLGGLSPVAEVPSIDEASEYGNPNTHGNDAAYLGTPSPSPRLDVKQPPTPAQTPPLPGSEAELKCPRFHSISTTECVTAVSTQNMLRSALHIYFPPEQYQRYRRSRLTLLPQMDRLWGPIFENSGNQKGKSNGRTADMILAMGCQSGVKIEFLSALTSQIERLGSKSTGMSRSGRLDLRYLIANAMQSFTTQPLGYQLHDGPFDSPHVLACLIIPHLATYLATNSSTRFLLLEYPAEHLATVVALQKLVGSDILKVAGIIDSEATTPHSVEPSSPVDAFAFLPPTPTSPSSLSQLEIFLEAISLPGSPFRPSFASSLDGPTIAHSRRMSFSKADYILTDSATDVEVSTFVGAVWKVLINIDSFYAPDHHIVKPARSSSSLPGLVSRFASHGTKSVSTTINLNGSTYLSPGNTPRLPFPPGVHDSSRMPADLPSAPPSFPLPDPPRDRSPSKMSTKSTQSRKHMIIPGTGNRFSLRARSLSGILAARRERRSGSVGDCDADGEVNIDTRSTYTMSVYAASVTEDGDFYDAEERRLMPLHLRESEIRRGNSRKALKLLGLA